MATDKPTTNQKGKSRPSMESAAYWFTVAALAFGAVAAVTGVFAWYFTDKVAEEKDRQLAAFQSESKKATALADARSAEANSKAAEAVEGTAAAVADAAAANERASALERQASEQRERAATAELETARLRARMEPRRLTAAQRSAIVSTSRGATKGPVHVECPIGSQEACSYAEEIENALTAGGWAVTSSINALTDVRPGLLLMQRNAGVALPHVAELNRILTGAGMTLTLGFNARVAERGATILVGPKE